MGENIERLDKALTVELAGRIRVSGYERTSSTGNRVHVGSYYRSPAKMKTADIKEELRMLHTVDTPEGKNRKAELTNELRKRESGADARNMATLKAMHARDRAESADENAHSAAHGPGANAATRHSPAKQHALGEAARKFTSQKRYMDSPPDAKGYANKDEVKAYADAHGLTVEELTAHLKSKGVHIPKFGKHHPDRTRVFLKPNNKYQKRPGGVSAGVSAGSLGLSADTPALDKVIALAQCEEA